MKILGLQVEVTPQLKLRALQLQKRAKKLGQHTRERVQRVQASFAKMPKSLGRFAAKTANAVNPSDARSIFEVRRAQDGWMIAEKGSAIPLRVFVKKPEAIREARRMAREHRTDLDIFGRNGEHQNHYSFST
jgi:hypothetical protein